MGILLASTLIAICTTIASLVLGAGILDAVLVYIGSGTISVFLLTGWVLLRDHLASKAQQKTSAAKKMAQQTGKSKDMSRSEPRSG
ncbi:hypothetical protein [Tropicimonas sp. IMCC34043]|uniref:hypothetical protein n=1 Tax=Tropicimonas sp. IMCC34043 TaxID=2248760 RepID=UPI0013001AD1|nr:hypothetical protein [Tropicimonas sp. IMCC34043]